MHNHSSIIFRGENFISQLRFFIVYKREINHVAFLSNISFPIFNQKIKLAKHDRVFRESEPRFLQDRVSDVILRLMEKKNRIELCMFIFLKKLNYDGQTYNLVC